MKSIILFWDWIRYNEQTLRNLRNEKPAVQKMFIYWLDKHLHNYCEQLESILMFPANENEPTQLVISASGNPEYFSQVTTLIDNAPKLKNWKFVAFIQPSHNIDEMEAGLDKPYVFKDIELKASELKFMPFQYEDVKKIDMIVYLKNFTVHCSNKNLLHVVFIILQDIIGEKSLFENINFVELAQLPAEEQNEVIYLYELQSYLDMINRTTLSK
ncbi:hypothetical protein FNO01nite_33750 [Flavobacterium noncentrifugens]|uniref:Uncharacterized protein n=1 Tax=Flavobacterium noncentrifugens TaxID=1128970 RepID=A0A1G8UUB9_9FLAO|nr:hypothetical protein [Flavobacterium noncentrifugens]GEP52703.1 hypothetical protein FNO01nite_33750 [Flavobacterium noncentrifugens]SDJ57393.1 hypothetical protein SAMN04487935_1050 [Flavobacterium noncentrifugens]